MEVASVAGIAHYGAAMSLGSGLILRLRLTRHDWGALRVQYDVPFEIETFPNPKPERNYTILHTCPEFTSVCPKTGQPDFATIDLEYIPGESCIELKSLKLYYYSFRNEGIFYEAVVNRLLDELADACSPKWMRVTGRFNVRGGIESVVVCETGPKP